jgi:RHS repeat-associated protein
VRVGKTIGATTTDYLLDLASTLPVVISDTDAVYLYGLDIIAEQLARAERYYYVHDGLGSVRQLLDTTSQIATRYTYDPFGVPLAGDGVPNPWQFTGEAWDAGVELLHLRARYYQPGTGRFITKDPRPGNVWRPGTLNGYVYVGNNPANWVDPTGLQCVGPDCGPQPSGVPTPEPTPDRVRPGPRPTWTPIPSGAAPTGTAGPTVPPEPSPQPRPTAQHMCVTPTPHLPARPEPIPTFEEWITEWPDPFGELPPSMRVRLAGDAQMMYWRHGIDIVLCALSKLDNPLLPNEMDPGYLGGLTIRTIANGVKPHFIYFIEELKMTKDRWTNYEPCFLTLLTSTHIRELGRAQWRAYHEWWLEWVRLYGPEHEEIGHFYDLGLGEGGVVQD